ncbi:MAG: hypothetical protein ACLRX5_07360 [Slackia sp.]
MGVQLDTYSSSGVLEGSNLAMNLKAVTRKSTTTANFCAVRPHGRTYENQRRRIDYVYYSPWSFALWKSSVDRTARIQRGKTHRDFVIAIDTSSSTKDGLVRKFIERLIPSFPTRRASSRT